MIIFTEKTAGSTARAAGVILSAIARHPITTIGVGATIAASPWILDKAFKMYMMHGQGKENRLTRQNQEVLKQIAENTHKKDDNVTKPRQIVIPNLS